VPDSPTLKSPWEQQPRTIGRYTLYGEIASGGMASVHIGRLVGPVGFLRTVAIKRLHPQYAKDPSFVDMFLDEARLAARIRHPNVVSTLEIVSMEDELFLVMDYVHGESLGRLVRAAADAGTRLSPRVVSSILVGALLGLHAAHEATNELGQALSIVHRDVSPQNILVGIDGVARVADFGVAKAASRVHTTRGGDVKGKISYMAPEQLLQEEIDRRTDLYGASIVLWEALVGRRMFPLGDIGSAVARLLRNVEPEPPSRHAPDIPPALDALVLKGLSRRREDRFATAREMAQALELAEPPAGALEVGGWVEAWAREGLELRSENAALHHASTPPEPTAGHRAPLSDATIRIGSGTSTRSSPPTAVTELSLTTGTPSTIKPPRVKAGWVVAGVAMVAALLSAFAAGSHRSSASTAAIPDRSDAATIADLPSAGGEATTPVVVPTSSSGAGHEHSESSAPVAPRHSSPPGGGRTVKPAKRSCDPPYVLNPDGTKHFKAECF
jgi:serine/threonine protein kinase